MSDSGSVWSFIAHADVVVKCVLLILLAASVFSWTIIVQRVWLLGEAWHSMGDFFQTMRDTGFREYERLRVKPGLTRVVMLANAERVMRILQHQRMKVLEGPIGMLATIGSTAPYVGLFGTVWGIMSSFRMLGGVQQATLPMVAPGISEALIATAVGLFAAIPAVIAYNRFTHQLTSIEQEYDVFQEKIVGMLEEQVTISKERSEC